MLCGLVLFRLSLLKLGSWMGKGHMPLASNKLCDVSVKDESIIMKYAWITHFFDLAEQLRKPVAALTLNAKGTVKEADVTCC